MLPVLLDGAGERQALRLMEGGEVSIELLTALDVQPHLGFLPGWGALRELIAVDDDAGLPAVAATADVAVTAARTAARVGWNCLHVDS
jgi:hypothetical protein